LIIVTIFNNRWLSAYIYWLRYDVEFLIAFVLLRRLFPLYRVWIGELSRIVLISWGLMIVTALTIRYVMSEYLLTFFWFDPQVSGFSGGNWWPPKIYYVIEGTETIRFQWLLEWPNQMAYFLLVYIALFWFHFRTKKSYRFISIVSGILCLYLLFMTYSRSAIVWAILSGFFVALLYILKWGYSRRLISRGKIILITLSTLFIITAGGFLSYEKINTLFIREWSTHAHFERMMIGVERFLAHPFWVGLWEAGPGSRGVHDINNDKKYSTDIIGVNNLVTKIASSNKNFYLMSEYFYIPESWYIQQLIQGGFIGFILFSFVMIAIVIRFRNVYPLLWGFVAVMIMNMFLHAFESMHISLLLFSILSTLCPVWYSLLNKIWKKSSSF